MFDVAFDGYTGGMDTDIVSLDKINKDFVNDTYETAPRYNGKSMIALHFPRYLFVQTISNSLVELLRQIFVPQLVDTGNDYDYSAIPTSDLQQCAALLQAIFNELRDVNYHIKKVVFSVFNVISLFLYYGIKIYLIIIF
jgi:hypothetical protein